MTVSVGCGDVRQERVLYVCDWEKCRCTHKEMYLQGRRTHRTETVRRGGDVADEACGWLHTGGLYNVWLECVYVRLGSAGDLS